MAKGDTSINVNLQYKSDIASLRAQMTQMQKTMESVTSGVAKSFEKNLAAAMKNAATAAAPAIQTAITGSLQKATKTSNLSSPVARAGAAAAGKVTGLYGTNAAGQVTLPSGASPTATTISNMTKGFVVSGKMYDISTSKTRQFVAQYDQKLAAQLSTKDVKTVADNIKAGFNPLAKKTLGTQESSVAGLTRGFGFYAMSGMLGGQAGIAGAYLMGSKGGGTRAAGAGLIIGGTLAHAGMAATQGAMGIADMMGLSPEGLQAYGEFQQAITLTARNLGDFSKDTLTKLNNSANDLATTFGAAGNQQQFAELFRRITGSDVFQNQTGSISDKLAIANRVATASAQLASVTANPNVIEQGTGVFSLYEAAQASTKAINNAYTPEDVAALLNTAQKKSILDLSSMGQSAYSSIAQAVSTGTDLKEAIMQFALMSNVGYTPAKAATSIAALSAKLTAPKTINTLQSVLGPQYDVNKLYGMSATDIAVQLTKQAGTEKLSVPQFQEAIQTILPDIRSSKMFVQLTNALNKGVTDLSKGLGDSSANAKTAFEDFISGFENVPQAVKDLAMEAGVANAGLMNQLGNLTNAFTEVKFKATGYIAPILTNLIQRFVGRETNTPVQFGSQQLMIDKNGKLIESLDDVIAAAKKDAEQAGDVGYAAVIDGVGNLAKSIEHFTTKEGFDEAMKDITNLFDMLTIAASGFLEVISWLVSWFGTGKASMEAGQARDITSRYNIPIQDAYKLVKQNEAATSTPGFAPIVARQMLDKLAQDYQKNMNTQTIAPIATVKDLQANMITQFQHISGNPDILKGVLSSPKYGSLPPIEQTKQMADKMLQLEGVTGNAAKAVDNLIDSLLNISDPKTTATIVQKISNLIQPKTSYASTTAK